MLITDLSHWFLLWVPVGLVWHSHLTSVSLPLRHCGDQIGGQFKMSNTWSNEWRAELSLQNEDEENAKWKQRVLPEHAETSLWGVDQLFHSLNATQPESYWQAAVHEVLSEGVSHGVLNRSNGGTSPDGCVRLQVEWLFSAEACNKSHQSDSLTAAVSAQTPGMKSLTHTGMSRWCKGFTEGTLQHLHIKNHMCYLQQGFKRQTRFNLYFMLLLNSDSREITGHEGTENQTSVSQR